MAKPRSLWSNDEGAVALLFGLALLPIMLAVAIAVEFTGVSDTRVKLDAAADAAALNAVITTKQLLTIPSCSNCPLASDGDAIAAGIAAGQRVFQSLVADMRPTPVAPQSVTTVRRIGQTISANVSYTAQYAATIGSIAGIDRFDVANSVEAANDLPLFVDIHLLLDNSASMGVGATQDDVDLMISRIGCAFGCHLNGDTHYDDAHAAGATLRIDVLREAVATMLRRANQTKVTADQFRFALYTFSKDLTPLQGISSDYTALQAVTAAIATDVVAGNTNFHVSLGAVQPMIPRSGDGSAPDKRKVFVILITDGVEDALTFEGGAIHGDPNYVNWFGNGPQGPEWQMQAFDPSMCSPIKNTGSTMMVLNVDYYAPSGVDERFDYVRNSVLPNKASTIAACASSPQFFYSANSPAEINDAMQAIFGQIAKATRLTQ